VTAEIAKNRCGTKGEFGLRLDFERATFAAEELPTEDEADSERLLEFDGLCTRVLEVVRASPGISGRRARIEVGAKAQAVYAALEKLEANGAVRKSGKGWSPILRALGGADAAE
jgi:hypothetical protein